MVRVVDLKPGEDAYLRLRARAAKNGGSVADAACDILKETLTEDPLPTPEKPMTGKEFVEGIRNMVEPFGGIELDVLPRMPIECPHCLDRRPE